MLSYIFLIILNIISFYFITNKSEQKNAYEIEKKVFLTKKIFLIVFLVNIISFILNGFAFIVLFIYKESIFFIDFLFFLLSFFSFIIITFSYKKPKKGYRLISDKLINSFDTLIIFSFSLIINLSLFKYEFLSFIVSILCFFIILSSLIIIFIQLKKNREYICITANNDEYLEDIKFYNKLQINRGYNYILYLLAYIVFVFIRIPYVYLLYVLIAFFLLFISYRKYKKISNLSNKLYNIVTIAKKMPGVIFAFQFIKDFLLLKKIILLFMFFLIEIIVLYGIGEGAFVFASLQLSLLLLYIIIDDKLYLISYIKSLNPDFVNDKVYSISSTKKVSYIETINVLNIKLYRFIIKDNQIYKSHLVLYDPSDIYDELEIRINKSNLNDYIINECLLYEE